MKAQEALHEISTMVFRNTDNFEMRISKECYKNIVNALKKQIPKRPIEDGYYDEPAVCPNCGESIIKLLDNNYPIQYCLCCGQAINVFDHPTEKGGVQE